VYYFKHKINKKIQNKEFVTTTLFFDFTCKYYYLKYNKLKYSNQTSTSWQDQLNMRGLCLCTVLFCNYEEGHWWFDVSNRFVVVTILSLGCISCYCTKWINCLAKSATSCSQQLIRNYGWYSTESSYFKLVTPTKGLHWQGWGWGGGVMGFSPLNGIYLEALPDRYMSFYTSAKWKGSVSWVEVHQMFSGF